MARSPIRVLVVDDAVVVRRLVARMLEEHPAFAVPTVAANGRLALAKLEQARPDAVVLDIEMPELDGLATLTRLRRTHPRLPVIMFSTLTEAGATATLHALSLGATDYVTKPSGVGGMDAAMAQVREQLVPRLLALTAREDPPQQTPGLLGSRPTALHPFTSAPKVTAGDGPRPAAVPVEVLAVGASTGGPNALATLLETVGELPVPVVVTQHIPPVFSTMLAQRLDKLSPMSVREATTGDVLRPGTVWIAPGDHHLRIERHGTDLVTVLDDSPPESSCRPAVDVMFRSVAETFGGAVLAVVLTGMGSDGLRGAARLHDLGARILCQDRATSVVWGMPGAITEADLADAVLPLESIGADIRSRLVPRRAPAVTTP